MNKIEYLSALKEALKDTDASIMDEIVSDYEEHFQVGIENGKSEEQICEDLGDIEDLIKDIKAEYQTGGKEEDHTNSKDKKSKEWHFNIPNIDSEKIGGAINSALDSAGEAISKIDVIELGQSIKSTIGQASTTINNFADNYLKNIGTGPFDFSKKSANSYKDNVSKSYDASEEQEDRGKSSVSYDSEVETETAEQKVEFEDFTAETAEKAYEESIFDMNVDDNGEALKDAKSETVEEPQINASDEAAAEPIIDCVFENTDCSESKNQEAFEKKSKPDALLNLEIDGVCADVVVQKSSNDKINISYENNGNERQRQMFEFYSYKEGNTVYAGIRRVGKAIFLFNFKLYAISINIELPENVGNVNIKTASGNIRISDARADRMVTATASGDVSIDRIYTTDLRIKCSSGDIRLNDLNSIQINAATMSGDVRASGLEAKFVSLKSTSGDVETRNLTADIIDTSTLSGDIDIVNMKASECKVRSTSGNIDIDEFTMNNADISSVSGDIKLVRTIGDGLRVCNTSGNDKLEVNVKKCHASSKSGNVDVKSEGDIVLESSSTSGNVNVVLKNYGNGYSVKSRTTSGELYINYNNVRQRNLKTGTYTYGNQGSELTISSVSGDIHLTD